MSSLQEIVLDLASAVLLVVTPEVLVVNQTRRILSDLSYLPGSLMHLIVNRSGSSGLNSTVIQNTLRRPILMSLPEDSSVSESLHSSKPFVIFQSQSPVAKGTHDIVRKLTAGILQRGKEVGRTAPPSKKKEEVSPGAKDYTSRSPNEKKMENLWIHLLC